ncbi:3-oxoacyl-[acyl-carrier-protein] synthase III C-terminal domain-containing protein [Emcibacter sp.]|uniref:3-oxoacyl-[acyl-carrier-protein] synthase III C-terminal domain-containing protein n=1 Tax=Emcibacter sp. TaxID=1979954 RepID=UPI002AA6A16C|nr:3-oxoacyl-[acyl-carrier-protein] synthase III C-terminal domain-containing protein [Emcibacter sp.]
MNKVGIKSWGSYIPSRRIHRSTIFQSVAWANPALKGLSGGRRSFCGWDEDSITMAVESARESLKRLAGQPGDINALLFASTSFPFLDRQNSTLVSAALNLPAAVRSLDLAGSLRAGTSGLIEAQASARGGDTVLVSSDNRHAKPGSSEEMNYGSAAASLVLGAGEVVAEFLGTCSRSFDLVDHYRSSGMDADYGFEARWVRDEGYIGQLVPMLSEFLDASGMAPQEVDHAILPATSDRLNRTIAGRLGIRNEAVTDGRFLDVGHTGTAHSLLLLTDCLNNAGPGETILVCGFGQGCDAVLLRTTEKLAGRQTADVLQTGSLPEQDVGDYLQFLSFGGQVSMDWGMRAERDNRTAMSSYYRNRETLTAFVGGKCRTCSTVQFPRSAICVNPDCNAEGSQEDFSMLDLSGRVKSFTEDWQAYCAEPPLKYGHVGFDGGANILMEFADMPVGSLKVGMPVRPVFRIKDKDSLRHYHRYFWKVTAVAHNDESTTGMQS